jgi:hypothetical protein
VQADRMQPTILNKHCFPLSKKKLRWKTGTVADAKMIKAQAIRWETIPK